MKGTNVERGEFPFKLIDGPHESRYLTWVRNHSNYMAERGFVDYMRIVAILIRGIFINFLTLLPWLILGAVLLGVLYNPMLDDWHRQISEQRQDLYGETRPDWLFLTRSVEVRNSTAPEAAAPSGQQEVVPSSLLWTSTGRWVWWAQKLPFSAPPYILTPWVIVASAIYFLLFPVVIRVFKVFSHKKSLETGRESSVKMRDGFERSFGGCLIAVLAIGAFETLPLLIHGFHELKEGKGLLAAMAGGSSILAASTAGKLISVLGKAKQKIAMVLIGLLGLMLPLLVVLYVADYLVYGEPGYPFAPWMLLVMPGVLVVGIVGVVVGGMWVKTLKRFGWVLQLLLWVGVPLALLLGLHFGRLLEPSLITVLAVGIQLWIFCWLAVDVNLTSVHGLYRDRLAAAYLVGEDTRGDVDIEEDIDLHDICCYEAGSTSPYHLVNVAHNLQKSRDIGIRERNSDFFIFSRRFVGSRRTGYCRSDSLERVYPQIDLATAMAISAAAAAPNMGTNTSRLMVALLTLLNVRLGYWIPNPGRLEGDLARGGSDALQRRFVAAADQSAADRVRNMNLGYRFEEVFEEELGDIQRRWKNAYAERPGTVADERRLRQLRGDRQQGRPSPDHDLIGIGFSGGGIRSATLNMGIAQAFHRAGVFDHIDYMSTVSGGGYLGSSISTLMRFATPPYSEITGKARVVDTTDELVTVEVTCSSCDGAGCTSCSRAPTRTYQYLSDAELAEPVRRGAQIAQGEPLIRRALERGDLHDRFRWRVRPSALAKEMLSRLNETDKWVNLSDGGHIENLATIELLRRRCRFIFIGDGEADPELHFGSLATLIRYARIDLGIQIEIDPREIRLQEPAVSLLRDGAAPIEAATEDLVPRNSGNHFAIGRIWYPRFEGEGFEPTPGHLVYLKSSFTGDEEEIIQQYRNTHPAFPHETTADQFFDEGQFEAYRSLGQHIGQQALSFAPHGRDAFTPAADGSRRAADIYRQWAAGASAPRVADFFLEWCRNLEREHPVPWPRSADEREA